MDLGAISPVDHMAVGSDAIFADEETAAARKLLATSVKGFDGYGGWLDPSNQLGKLILSIRQRHGTEQFADEKSESNAELTGAANYAHFVR